MSRVTVNSMKRGMAALPAERELLKKSVLRALESEGVDAACLVCVYVTDNEGIRSINARHRGIDRATDVLSFPMLDLAAGEKPVASAENMDPEIGLLFLGEIVISLQRAKEQAAEYGHSVERELAFLAVHSVLHLLGYDHEDDGPQSKLMRSREEAILSDLGLTR
jgi:probable rRNA maturation factor